jgi:hypothetical protein
VCLRYRDGNRVVDARNTLWWERFVAGGRPTTNQAKSIRTPTINRAAAQGAAGVQADANRGAWMFH